MRKRKNTYAAVYWDMGMSQFTSIHNLTSHKTLVQRSHGGVFEKLDRISNCWTVEFLKKTAREESGMLILDIWEE